MSSIIIINGLTIFEYAKLSYRNELAMFYYLLIFHMTISIFSVFLYFLKTYMKSLVLKNLKIINQKTNLFFYNGYEQMFLKSLLIFMHPFYINQLQDVDVPDLYFKDSYIVKHIKKNINDYLLISQITVHYFYIINFFF